MFSSWPSTSNFMFEQRELYHAASTSVVNKLCNFDHSMAQKIDVSKNLSESPFQPSQLFVSHVNGSPSFVRKCRKCLLAQGSSGRRVTLLP